MTNGLPLLNLGAISFFSFYSTFMSILSQTNLICISCIFILRLPYILNDFFGISSLKNKNNNDNFKKLKTKQKYPATICKNEKNIKKNTVFSFFQIIKAKNSTEIHIHSNPYGHKPHRFMDPF